jgi:hypothetical protein
MAGKNKENRVIKNRSGIEDSATPMPAKLIA